MLKTLKQVSFVLIVLTLIVFTAKAQDSKLGTWAIATVVMPGDSVRHWGGYTEFQVRMNGPLSQFQYYEAKVGLSYNIDKNFIALLGTGTYHTFDYNDLSKGAITNETRFWEQMTINQYLSRLKFEHRYRAEQRIVNDVYRNRFRYRLNMFIPLNNKKIIAKTWFISVFDEIFINNKAPNFERNRVSAALGYQFDQKWIAQAGWLNQTNFTERTSSGKNNVMLMLMYRINRKNSQQREQLPTTTD
ncbi:DUF2490 domain-containing protein [Mucilaginibacter psychrotolerans]|uniref:DUF2490 domain-containing protein n=1 Tax=Mucilaginibacter psychrotolerans TaxID=1524096 RepID=A0A4Y8SII3_9SPHI|nr:DUF2490 domain-containing protein [Mucilaginibacter psychrotolerans]TFF38883.1 DUF2490 domain-containing protein [Mucilaginibacter psychrotolerans]